MSDFIKDTILIDEKLNLTMPTIGDSSLKAVMLPYYVDSNSMDLMVVMMRSLSPGGFKRTGKKMGITALTITLPEDKQITVEEAYDMLQLPAKLQRAIPFGSVMTDPMNSDETFELVLIEIDPVSLLDKKRGIVYQEKGKFEIGAIRFSDILEGINNQLIVDMKTRLILNELYIMAMEQNNRERQENIGAVGGGSNLPPGFGEQKDTVKTADIPDEVIAQNSQKDFGAIYSKASATSDTEFVPITKPGT